MGWYSDFLGRRTEGQVRVRHCEEYFIFFLKLILRSKQKCEKFLPRNLKNFDFFSFLFLKLLLLYLSASNIRPITSLLLDNIMWWRVLIPINHHFIILFIFWVFFADLHFGIILSHPLSHFPHKLAHTRLFKLFPPHIIHIPQSDPY